MANIRIPAITSNNIKSFSAGIPSLSSSFIQNGVIKVFADGTPYVTQRPSFETFSRPSDGSVTDARGRGIFFSSTSNVVYFVNNDVVYNETYSGPLSVAATNAGLSAGTGRVYFSKLNGVVYIIDPENNEGVFINGSEDIEDMDASGTGTFTTFPPNNSKVLAHGVVVLDKTMYVLTEDAQIWGSDLNDGASWTDALNFITAEKEEAVGKYIAKHHDNIAVFTSKTIEFFYDAANAVGSPLAARQDISYNIGCADPSSVWRNGDTIYFLGIDTTGEIAAYSLINFQLNKISDDTLTSFFTNSIAKDSLSVVGSGAGAGNSSFYTLTLYYLSTDATPVIAPTHSFVYNSDPSSWTSWVHEDFSNVSFPVVGWTIADDLKLGEGILSSGEILKLSDNFVPVDTLASGVYIAPGYIGDGYFATESGQENAITLKIHLPRWDNGNRNWKYISELRFVGDSTSITKEFKVRWAEDRPQTYGQFRTIDISNSKNKLTRLGRTKSRFFECEYSGQEQIRFEGLDIEFTEGDH